MNTIKPNKDRAAYFQWGVDHPYCQACGIPFHEAAFARWPGLSNHHIAKPHRSHDAANLLRLCQRDHDLAEGRAIRVHGSLLPKLTLGICLNLKLTREPEQWDPDRLRELLGYNLPDMERIPDFLEDEFQRRRPRDTKHFARSLS